MSKGKWEMVPLEQVIANRLGSIDPSKYPDETFDLYSIPSFDRGQHEIVQGSVIGSSKQIVQENDVMLSKIVPHIRRAWVVGSSNGRRMIASGEWIVFRSTSFHPAYLKRVLTSNEFHTQFMGTVAGVGGSLLRARPSQVAKIHIPCPPLPEQRRIAAILDTADLIRRKRKAAIAKLDELAQSVFYEMFGDPVKNEKGWEISELSSIAEIRIGPFGSLLHKNDYVPDGIPLINPCHMIDRKVYCEPDYSVAPDKLKELASYRVKANDLIFARRGDIGRCAIITETEDGYLCGTGSMFVRPNPNTINSIFLLHAMTSNGIKQELENKSKGITMKNLNSAELGSTTIPVPPIKKQNRFFELLSQIESLSNKQNLAFTDEDLLFSSLQHRAFSGEL